MQIASVVGSLATAGVAGFSLLAWRQASAALRQVDRARMDMDRPVVVPVSWIWDRTAQTIEVIVENFGNGPAFELCAMFGLPKSEAMASPLAPSGKHKFVFDFSGSAPLEEAKVRFDFKDLHGRTFTCHAIKSLPGFSGVRLVEHW